MVPGCQLCEEKYEFNSAIAMEGLDGHCPINEMCRTRSCVVCEGDKKLAMGECRTVADLDCAHREDCDKCFHSDIR